MKKLSTLILLLVSINTFASDRVTLFTHHELNDSDSISGVGISGIIGARHGNFKSEVVTSLNSVTVLDTDGYQNDYLGLDLGLRFGYFNDVFLYFEGGIDMFEAIFEHEEDEPIFHSDNYYDSNTIDGYAALGAGIQAGNLRIEGFVKARHIDADYWEADKTIFYGMKLSLAF
jgi:hypothetical protein